MSSKVKTLLLTSIAVICGMYFGHPQAEFFSLGKLGRDQVADYARRRGEPVAETEKWMQLYLGY